MRLELTTPCLKGRCSNRLSYGPIMKWYDATGVRVGARANLAGQNSLGYTLTDHSNLVGLVSKTW